MWAYKAWQGRQLPERLTRDEQLPAYATWCNAVEGNTTFYGLPSASTVESWAEQTPADFRFLFKLPRTITHERRLRGADDEVREFLELLAPLGERATTLSIQLPASFGPPDLGALATFVRRLPTIDTDGHRFAVEVRHPAFFETGSVARETLQRILADEGVEWITLDSTTLFARPADDGDGARDVATQAAPAGPSRGAHRRADRADHRPRRPSADGRRLAAVDPRRGWLADGRSPADRLRPHAGQRRCPRARPPVPRAGPRRRPDPRSACPSRPRSPRRRCSDPDQWPTTPASLSAAASSVE